MGFGSQRVRLRLVSHLGLLESPVPDMRINQDSHASKRTSDFRHRHLDLSVLGMLVG